MCHTNNIAKERKGTHLEYSERLLKIAITKMLCGGTVLLF